jgi:hypothetical protein
MEENLSFSKINKNLKSIFGLRFNKEVAERIGMSEDSYKQRKKENSVPFKEIILCCDKEGWSPNWIFWNQGPQKREKISEEKTISLSELRQLVLFLDGNVDTLDRLLSFLRDVKNNENPR